MYHNQLLFLTPSQSRAAATNFTTVFLTKLNRSNLLWVGLFGGLSPPEVFNPYGFASRFKSGNPFGSCSLANFALVASLLMGETAKSQVCASSRRGAYRADAGSAHSPLETRPTDFALGRETRPGSDRKPRVRAPRPVSPQAFIPDVCDFRRRGVAPLYARSSSLANFALVASLLMGETPMSDWDPVSAARR